MNVRESVAIYGVKSCRDCDLVEYLTGVNGCQITPELVRASSKEELIQMFDTSEEGAENLLLLLEFAKRLGSFRPDFEKINSPGDVYKMLNYLKYENQEHFFIIPLNAKIIPICKPVEISVGDAIGCTVSIPLIFKIALLKNARSVIIVHNHPSGCPEPSHQDRTLTRTTKEAGETLGIKLVDHIIIGYNDWYSFADNGFL